MELVNERFPNGIFIKVATTFRADSSYEKEIMAALKLTGNFLHKSEMEYHGKFGHTIGQIHNIDLMSRIEICYTYCSMATKTVAHTIPGFQVINIYITYLESQNHKRTFYYSNSYDGSNFIRLTWSGNQVEDYTTHNFLECHQYSNHAIIINRRRLVSGIINTSIGVAVFRKVNIQPTVEYDSTDG